jgi:hypothetical protein
VTLPFLLGLVIGLPFLTTLMEEKPVARLEFPTVEPAPKAPAAESQANSRTGPKTDSKPTTGTTRVETELAEEKRGPCGPSSSG